jgi:malonyl-CoA O-methyltransferase
VLKPGGLFTFTAAGPDTLKEVRDSWSGIDRHIHVHRFIDMHDFGDALLRAGFAEPVMDAERLTITYPNLPALIGELRASGARNLAHGRPRGLTGRARGRRFEMQSAAARRNGPLSISVEVIHGHAWSIGQPARRQVADEVRVPVQSIPRRRI